MTVLWLVLQARSQELEVQFASTTAELKELKAKQKALESRNILLERMVQLNKQHQQPKSAAIADSNVRLLELTLRTSTVAVHSLDLPCISY